MNEPTQNLRPTRCLLALRGTGWLARPVKLGDGMLERQRRVQAACSLAPA